MKTDVLNLVAQFSNGQADQTVCSGFYDDLVKDLGRFPWITQVTLVPMISANSTVSLPDTMIDVRCIFWDDRLLGEMKIAEVEYFTPDWAGVQDVPHSYVYEGQTRKTLRVFPNPSIGSASQVFPNSAPLGQDFPARTLVVFHTETRANAPQWLDYPLVFAILALEYSRSSDHQNLNYAAACVKIANLLYRTVA